MKEPSHNAFSEERAEGSEDGLLGCILLDNDIFPQLSIVEDDFWDKGASLIYRIIRHEITNERRVDTHMLFDKIKSSKLINKCGGVNRIMNLTNATTCSTMYKHYEVMILESAKRRALVGVADQLYLNAKNPSRTTDRSSAVASLDLERLNSTKEKGASGSCLAKLAQTHIKKMKEGKLDIIKFRYNELADPLGGGLRPQTVGVLAARPGVGKTTLAICIMLSMARQGTPVIFYSLEMTKEQVAIKMIEAMSGVPIFTPRRKDGTFSDSDEVAINNAIFDLAMRRITVVDHLTIAERICGDCITYIRKRYLSEGKKPVVFLDYIQRCRPEVETGALHVDIGRIMWCMVNLARKEDLAIVILSQLNRGIESRKVKVPLLSDLKSSGDIEQDAHWIGLMNRPDFYDDTAEVGLIELFFPKNRFGKTFSCTLKLRGECSQVVSSDRALKP